MATVEVSETTSTTNKEMTFAEKQAERMKRLRSLHSARNEARSHNHQEVVAEEARNKLPPNYEAKRRQAEWLLDDQKKREEAAKEGKEYDRVKLLNISATEAERLERKKKKKNPDQGFSTYEQATVRQYNRLVKNMPAADMEQYEKQKQKYGDAFYGGPNVIIHGMHEDRKDAIDKMVDDLEGQIAKRAKYSRRRIHNDDADIDYINERNAKFNKKLERFYGEHTSEIKQNLERGTAI
ncbi:Pre-mRNA-splicing factor Syf2 [Papilio machaon]|uniref:Pre-mRNA-splicing factor SYF2 n=1 Tax=Papilio machaon TaxID=76193 RepID=A0A194RLB4_PAPMA|nr:pre-mRNA-splicing factor Syf2 [Papilio machaon]KPJ18623.1 Pre-mRNA-splicing factor Syf2 [Papilio machaon]